MGKELKINIREKLLYQFHKYIVQAFKPRIDKHSYKNGNCNKLEVFSLLR